MAPTEDDTAKNQAAADREYARLWRAWRTVHEMVQDRVCAPRAIAVEPLPRLTCLLRAMNLQKKKFGFLSRILGHIMQVLKGRSKTADHDPTLSLLNFTLVEGR